MRDQCHRPPAEQFVQVERAAESLNMDSDVLRQAIACGLVPIRRDNEGGIRVHMDDVPGDLQEQLQDADVQHDLQVATLSDQVLTLQRQHSRLDAQRQRLEALVVRQAELLHQLADDEHAVRAIDEQAQHTSLQTARFIATTENALRLLDRAVCESEEQREQIAMLQQQLSAAAQTTERLERELKQRDAVISSQQSLLDRMVTMAERTVTGSSDKKHATLGKRTFWQRLWGSGKGI